MKHQVDMGLRFSEFGCGLRCYDFGLLSSVRHVAV